MNVIPAGEPAPNLNVTTLAGESFELHKRLESSPLVLLFARPEIHSSRLVVGYLRRLEENVPGVSILIVLQGDRDAVVRYANGYLDRLYVAHDETLEASHVYGVTHVPSLYYLVQGEAPTVELSFTGFLRPALNRLARMAAEATGAKPKELVTGMDNKGEYELAERALSHPEF